MFSGRQRPLWSVQWVFWQSLEERGGEGWRGAGAASPPRGPCGRTQALLVAVAHAVAPGAALQLLILRLLLPLAGCTLGDGDAEHLGALGREVWLSKARPGRNAPSQGGT